MHNFFFWNISLCKLTSIQQQVGLQRFLRLFWQTSLLDFHSSALLWWRWVYERLRVFSLIWNGDKKKKSIRLSEERRKKLRTLLIKTQKTCQKHNTSQKHWEKTEGASIIIECRLCIIFVIPIRRECNTCTYILRIVISHWGQTLVPCWSVRES